MIDKMPSVERKRLRDMTNRLTTGCIEEFGALPDPAKREVLAGLLRLSRELEDPVTGDDELTSAANEVFLSDDERERDE